MWGGFVRSVNDSQNPKNLEKKKDFRGNSFKDNWRKNKLYEKKSYREEKLKTEDTETNPTTAVGRNKKLNNSNQS